MMLVNMLRSHILDVFGQLEIGNQVIHINKQELESINKTRLCKEDFILNKLKIKIDPELNFVNNFANLKSLGIIYKIYKNLTFLLLKF